MGFGTILTNLKNLKYFTIFGKKANITTFSLSRLFHGAFYVTNASKVFAHDIEELNKSFHIDIWRCCQIFWPKIQFFSIYKNIQKCCIFKLQGFISRE